MQDPEYHTMFAVEEDHWWFTARRLFVTVLLHTLPRRRYRIVDIGAGTGGMIHFLRQYGTVVGIEPNIVGRRLAKNRGIVLVSGDAEHTKIPSNSVDIVCFFDVLYHRGIRDTRAIIEAKRILRPGGWLVITDCALPFLDGPHDRAFAGRERYVLSRLCNKVLRTGFSIEKQSYMYFFLFPIIASKRLIDRFRVQTNRSHSDVTRESLWVNTFCMAVSHIEAWGLKFVSYPWGSSLCILARKSGGFQ